MSEGPRVFDSDEPPKWRQLILLLLVMLLAAGGAFLWMPSSAPTTTQIKQTTPQEKVETPQPKPKEKASAVAPTAEKPPIAVPTPPPGAPKVVVEAPKKTRPGDVSLLRVETVRSDANRFTVKLICRFSDPLKDPGLYGIGSDARVILIDTGALKTPGNPWGFGMPRELNGSAAEFETTLTLENEDSEIKKLDAVIALIHPAARETVEWTEFGKQAIGSTRTSSGSTFTLLDCKVGDESATFDVMMKFPPEDPLKPQIASSLHNFLKYELLLSDGSKAPISGGGGGGMPDKRFHYEYHFKYSGKKPAAYRVSFAPSLDIEEFEFSLRDVKIPRRDIASAAPAAPLKRGARSVRSEGFTISLKGVELIDGQKPAMKVTVNVAAPPNLKIVASRWDVSDAFAKDDRGTEMKIPDDYSPMTKPWNTIQCKADLRFPGPEAQMLSVFSGKYLCYAKDEEQSQEFDLADAALKFPITKGPVTLTDFKIVEDVGSVTYGVDDSVLPDEKFKNEFVRRLMSDAGGVEIKEAGSGGKFENGRSFYTVQYLLNGAKPAKMTVWYVTKGHHVRVPFEFKDIEIPRGAKKIEFAPAAPEF
jgi:hypothetical protein